MNKLVLGGASLGAVGLLLGVYVAFGVAPRLDYLESVETKSEAQRFLMYDLLDLQVNLGTAAMGLGLLGFLLAIVPAIKTKQPFALAAATGGMFAFFLGAAYGTHMFS